MYLLTYLLITSERGDPVYVSCGSQNFVDLAVSEIYTDTDKLCKSYFDTCMKSNPFQKFHLFSSVTKCNEIMTKMILL